MFTDAQLKVIAFCAEECTRQQSGEMSVYNMVRAWSQAPEYYSADFPVKEDMILDLAEMIEPVKNKNGYRCVPVTIRGILIPWEHITRQMELLVAAQNNLEPEDFYRAFEDIHPFEDGNGRVGVILYNYMKGTLDNPSFAPDYWSMDELYNRATMGDNNDKY